MLHHSIKRASFADTAPADCFAQVTLRFDSGTPIYNHHFLATPRELRISVADVKIKAVKGKPSAFAVFSDCFVRNLTFTPQDENNRPDDNFLDLLPGIEKTVVFKKPLPIEAVKLSWLNEKSRECLILGLSKSEEIHEKWTCTVFNATDRSLSVPVEVKSTDACLLDFPDKVELSPYTSGHVSISIGADIFKMAAEKQPVLPVDLHIGSACVLDNFMRRICP